MTVGKTRPAPAETRAVDRRLVEVAARGRGGVSSRDGRRGAAGRGAQRWRTVRTLVPRQEGAHLHERVEVGPQSGEEGEGGQQRCPSPEAEVASDAARGPVWAHEGEGRGASTGSSSALLGWAGGGRGGSLGAPGPSHCGPTPPSLKPRKEGTPPRVCRSARWVPRLRVGPRGIVTPAFACSFSVCRRPSASADRAWTSSRRPLAICSVLPGRERPCGGRAGEAGPRGQLKGRVRDAPALSAACTPATGRRGRPGRRRGMCSARRSARTGARGPRCWPVPRQWRRRHVAAAGKCIAPRAARRGHGGGAHARGGGREATGLVCSQQHVPQRGANAAMGGKERACCEPQEGRCGGGVRTTDLSVCVLSSVWYSTRPPMFWGESGVGRRVAGLASAAEAGWRKGGGGAGTHRHSAPMELLPVLIPLECGQAGAPPCAEEKLKWGTGRGLEGGGTSEAVRRGGRGRGWSSAPARTSSDHSEERLSASLVVSDSAWPRTLEMRPLMSCRERGEGLQARMRDAGLGASRAESCAAALPPPRTNSTFPDSV